MLYYIVIYAPILQLDLFITNITAQIRDDLSLSSMAKQINISENIVIKNASEFYLQELQEDIEDYQEAVKRLSQNNKTIPWEQVKRGCGLLQD